MSFFYGLYPAAGSGSNVQATATGTDPGIPQLSYYSATQLRVYNGPVIMNGFRRFGAYTATQGPAYRFYTNAAAYAVYDEVTATEGYTQPALTAGQEAWIATFAVAASGDQYARCVFAPYLRVASWNAGTSTATVSTYAGAMTSGAWVGNQVLICSASGASDGRVFTITANTANTLTLDTSIDALALAQYDYLLIAPGPSHAGYSYKFMRSFKIDYIGSGAGYNWRNFTFSGDRAYSYHGGFANNITSTSLTQVDLSAGGPDPNHVGYVSPIASGLICNLHVNSTTTGAAAYMYISHDSSNHIISEIGLDRGAAGSGGDGMAAPSIIGLNTNIQSIWAQVLANNTGQIIITGWVE